MATLNTIRWQHRSLLVIVAGIAACLLWLNHLHNRQFDLTATASNSLSTISIDTLLLLPDPVEITAVAAPDRSLRNAIEMLVDRYRNYKPDITLDWVNPEVEPARVRALSASPGGELIIKYQEREKRLQQLSETAFTQALQQLARTHEQSVAFITGHQERQHDNITNNDFSYLAAALQKSGLQLQSLSLVSVPRIPDNIQLVVLAAPVSRYFVGEVASILDYIGRGGNLLWLIDDGNLAGLEALSVEFGIDLLPGTVIDAASQSWGAESPTFAVVDQLPRHPVNTGMQSPVLLPQSHALAITPLAGQTTLPLLQSGQNSWNETGPLAGEVNFEPEQQEQAGPLTLAASIERDIQGKAQRIIIVGDADLFANAWLGNGGNRDFAERLFNWLSADDALLSLNKNTNTVRDTLTQLTEQQSLMYGLGYFVVLPVLFFLIGTVLWFRQRSHRQIDSGGVAA